MQNREKDVAPIRSSSTRRPDVLRTLQSPLPGKSLARRFLLSSLLAGTTLTLQTGCPPCESIVDDIKSGSAGDTIPHDASQCGEGASSDTARPTTDTDGSSGTTRASESGSSDTTTTGDETSGSSTTTSDTSFSTSSESTSTTSSPTTTSDMTVGSTTEPGTTTGPICTDVMTVGCPKVIDINLETKIVFPGQVYPTSVVAENADFIEVKLDGIFQCSGPMIDQVFDDCEIKVISMNDAQQIISVKAATGDEEYCSEVTYTTGQPWSDPVPEEVSCD